MLDWLLLAYLSIGMSITTGPETGIVLWPFRNCGIGVPANRGPPQISSWKISQITNSSIRANFSHGAKRRHYFILYYFILYKLINNLYIKTNNAKCNLGLDTFFDNTGHNRNVQRNERHFRGFVPLHGGGVRQPHSDIRHFRFRRAAFYDPL